MTIWIGNAEIINREFIDVCFSFEIADSDLIVFSISHIDAMTDA